MIKNLQDLRLCFTASKTQTGNFERQWGSSSEKSIRRWDTQVSLSESLPPHYTKRAWTLNAKQNTTLSRSQTSLPDAKTDAGQYSDLFPKVPVEEPPAEGIQPEKKSEATRIAMPEPFAIETTDQHSRSSPIGEDPPQGTKPTMRVRHVDPIHISDDAEDLLGILNAQARKQEDEFSPGLVGGLLDLEDLPPTDTSDTDSAANQEVDPRPQQTQEKSKIAPPTTMDVKQPQYFPVMYTYHYGRSEFRGEHLAMHACTCPRSKTIFPPHWFAYLFGALTLVFCLPFLSGGLMCCNAMCQWKPKQHIRLQLNFPLWLTTNICFLIFSWDSIYGFGRCLEWQKSRELDDPEVALAIEKGDVRWLQQRVAAKKLLPFDILKGVGEPLAVSVLPFLPHDCD